MTSRFHADPTSAPARMEDIGSFARDAAEMQPTMTFDARLKGKRQAENVHFDVDESGKVSVVIFETTPTPDLRCVICWELFKDPVITPYGHSYCRECITQEIANSGRCPMTRRPLEAQSQLAPNLLARAFVDELRVHCTYGCTYEGGQWVVDDEGCPDVIAFGLRKAHHKGCQYAPAKCRYGGSKCPPVPRLDLEAHEELDCPYNQEARQREIKRRLHQVDPIEMLTTLFIASLVVFTLLQTEYFGNLLRKEKETLLILTVAPVTAAVAFIIAEYCFHNWGRQPDSDEED